MSEEKKVRLDDVVLRRELTTAEAMLSSVIQNNAGHDFIGHVDAARLILKTIINATPREVAEEVESNPEVASDEGSGV